MWNNMVKPDAQMTVIRRMRFASWITKATHTEYAKLTALPRQNIFANAPQCYVVRTLPVLS